ncbi:MAG TPA: fumarylacetoacetate hydrolase family protein [Chlamydiales bacterium]|nr:fumarylacetoacetate hydrolase family protein [Chlamydiales bacterium]
MEIRNIWCVARNYPEHAKELHNPIPTEPFFFLKAGSCATFPNQPIHLPPFSSQVEYELEIALQFDENLHLHRACLALDLTARDLQKKAKTQGHPWTLSKSFRHACPLGPFFPASEDLKDLSFELHVNSELRQKGNTREMLFSPKELASFLRTHFPVLPGDLLLTGTPAGVSQARPNDRLLGRVLGHSEAHWIVS